MTVRQRHDGTGQSTSVWPLDSAAANATLRLKTRDDIYPGRHDVLIVGMNEKFTFPARFIGSIEQRVRVYRDLFKHR